MNNANTTQALIAKLSDHPLAKLQELIKLAKRMNSVNLEKLLVAALVEHIEERNAIALEKSARCFG